MCEVGRVCNGTSDYLDLCICPRVQFVHEFIDALEGWLSHRVPTAGVRVQSEGGAARLLSTLIYADDLALLANCPLQLQALIDALAEFCSSAGLAVSAAKTQVMQFLPRMRGQALPLHSFWYGSDATTPTPLLNTSTYKYLGIHLLVRQPLKLYETSA